ncbi:MAG: thiamine pyrophosphate-dependent enzyme, partial [Bacteroidetes bacterium]|nr:thiamine pyrophosphate-dependent enzyme [Bacteroidota bacterium]
MNLEIFKKAIYVRAFETLLLKLFSEGKLNGTVHTCVGQEITPAILSQYITDNDTYFSNHRGHGHYLLKTNDYRGLLAEVMGKITGCSKGYGGSQHLYNKGFYSNGIQGGFAPVAVGFALASKLKNADAKNISVIFIGDGTLGEGTLYEAINLAAIYKAPILFVLENNKYAQSTSFKQILKGSLQSRIEGFGVDYYNASIYDLQHLDSTFKKAVENTRNCSPTFIEVECYRLNSHSKGDDNRNTDEIEHYKSIDPINVFERNNETEYNKLNTEANSFLDLLQLYVEKDETFIKSTSVKLIKDQAVNYSALNKNNPNVRVNESIYSSFKHNLEKDKSIVLFGEDIENNNQFNPKQYGGAFKVTKDLSNLFPSNIYNSPISEAGITGIGIGIALGGMKSLIEIMFGDFTTLVVDQILQQASKIQCMYGVKLDLPFVLRTPMGGKRGYGPTHSQSVERLFFSIPHINVIALNKRVEPKAVYNNILQYSNDATIVIENKLDYVRYIDEKHLETHDYFISDEF